MQKKYLMTPGPTPVPAEVLLTHGRADHPPPHAGLLGGVRRGDRGPQVRLPDRGRRAAVRLLGHGRHGGRDRELLLRRRHGHRVPQRQVRRPPEADRRDVRPQRRRPAVRVDRGRRARPTSRRRSRRTPSARGVIVTQSETSTRRAQRRRRRSARSCASYPTTCVLIVDSITGIGAVECKTDEWGLDVVMTGSQKGLMLPPGLAACTVSEKAWRPTSARRCRSSTSTG